MARGLSSSESASPANPAPRAAAPAKPNRSPLADHWRAISRTAKWKLRDAMTRDRIIANLKTLAWVVPLTILLWAYAETRHRTTLPNQHIPIQVRITDPDRIVRLQVPDDGNVVVEMAGPRAQLERVSRLVQGDGEASPVQLYIDPGLSPGEHQLSTADLLNAHELFVNHGVQVSNTDPVYITVDVDELVRREFEIVARADGLNLEDEPIFNPPRIELRVPASAVEGADRLTIEADLRQADIPSQPGQHAISDVPLIRPGIPGVAFEPRRVSATVKVRDPDARHVEPSVPVNAQAPHGFFETRRLVLQDEFLNNVVITGPADQIEALKASKVGPKAILELNNSDPLGEQITRTVRYNLPPGLKAEARTVTFVIQSRNPVE